MRIRQGRSRRWFEPVAGVTALLLATLVHGHMDTRTRAASGGPWLPDPERARLSSLGFRALVADYYWLQAVQLVGGSGAASDPELLARLIDVTTTVDPWVGHAYRFAAVWLDDSPESVRAANRVLARGISYHPQDWRNRFHLGFNHFFYLEDNERAAELLEGAVPLPRAPTYLGALVARLRADVGGLDTAASLLRRMAEETEDPYARAEYLKALDEIDTERAARLLDRARAEFQRRQGRDLRDVQELVEGPSPVLRRLPPPHPHFEGFRWQIDPDSGRIVSSFYRKRYRLHFHPSDEQRRQRWRGEQEART